MHYAEAPRVCNEIKKTASREQKANKICIMPRRRVFVTKLKKTASREQKANEVWIMPRRRVFVMKLKKTASREQKANKICIMPRRRVFVMELKKRARCHTGLFLHILYGCFLKRKNGLFIILDYYYTVEFRTVKTLFG